MPLFLERSQPFRQLQNSLGLYQVRPVDHLAIHAQCAGPGVVGEQSDNTLCPFELRGGRHKRAIDDIDLRPAFNFPGEGPADLACGIFNRIDITINAGVLSDLSLNANTSPASTFFETGEGPGIVNAPVAPDVIYAGRLGANPGISALDLNGFGQSTGNPAYTPDSEVVIPGESNFPNNPNNS